MPIKLTHTTFLSIRNKKNYYWLPNYTFLFLLFSVFIVNSSLASQTENNLPQTNPTAITTDKNNYSPLKIALPDEQSVNNIVDGRFQALINFLKEYWQIWGIDNKQEIAFIHLPTGAMQDALNQKLVDVAAISIFNPDQPLLYSLPIAKFEQNVFKRINQSGNDETRIGIHANTPHTLAHLKPSLNKHYYQDIDVMLSESQQLDMLYSTQPWQLAQKVTEYSLEKEFSTSHLSIPATYLHMATRSTDNELMKQINKSMRQTSITQVQLWSDKYQLNYDSPISLTLGHYLTGISEAESKYLIVNNEVYYPVTIDGMPPYIINDHKSSLQERGFIIDLLEKISARTGIIFKPYYLPSSQSTFTALSSNSAQLIVAAQQDMLSNQGLHYSVPYLQTQYSIIQRHDTTLTEEENTIALVKDKTINELITNKFPQAKFILFENTLTALTAVAQNKATLYIGNSLVSGYLIKQNAFSNLVLQPYSQFQHNAQLSFATAQEHQPLVTLINRALNDISNSEFDDMYATWSKTAFSQQQKQTSAGGVYKITVYILAGTLVICLFIFWVYYRELQVRKVGQKKVEKALAIAEHARTDAEKSSQAKATFLARMSHEIRTPMNGVLGMAEALTFTPLNIEQKELLDTLNGSARNLLALLNDVLDFSKMDAGKLTLESVPVNLHTLAQNIVNGISHLPKSDDLSLKLSVSDKITHHYFTDPTRLTQVLNNLLSNAIKFTDHGEVELSIDLLGSTNNKYQQLDTIRVAVRDTGIGIAEENQVALFTPFIQADDEVTRKFGGTGLGLSICQEIIKAMGGNIEIDSSPDHGSIFYFNLSLERANQIKSTGERRTKPRDFHDSNDTRFSHYRVLIAEDNPVNVKVLSAQLTRININADVAEDGQQAINMHREQPYDIIISDCHMPIVDGFELAKTLSNQTNNKQLWLIAITADALSGAAEKCLASGFNDYMAKPTPQEEVNNKLNTAHRFLSGQIS